MRNLGIIFTVIIAIVSIIALFSCEKEQSEPVSLHFASPDDNLIIENDTILFIKVDLNDKNGKINKLDLFINDSLVNSFFEEPFEFEWDGPRIDNLGPYIIKAVAYSQKGPIAQSSIGGEVYDFRSQFFGSYSFEVIRRWSSINPQIPVSIDTFQYNGLVRRYKPEDSNIDLSSFDYSFENPRNRVTINFLCTCIITPEIDREGVFIPKSGYHYGHGGRFLDGNTLDFQVGGLGGLSYTISYKVNGTKLN